MRAGWHQIAFERDAKDELTPAIANERCAALVRIDGHVRVFDSSCPHRGANLAYGGRLDAGRVICPFHGFRIGLGAPGERAFSVAELPTLVIGGLILARPDDPHDTGLGEYLQQLSETAYFVPGFALEVAAAAELVIENAFDAGHFRTVHGIGNEPRFTTLPSQRGELAVSGVFEVPPSPWQRSSGTVRAPFVARAFSPYLVVSELGGSFPYHVLTAATPQPSGCTIRLTLVVPPNDKGEPPGLELCEYLLQQSLAGLQKDQVIWEHLDPQRTPTLTPSDAGTVAFREFCDRFDR